jgi:hypothetical protein
MQPDWTWHYLDRIAKATERGARNSSRTRRDIEAVKGQVDELTGWVRRIALAMMLWGSGGLLTLNADQLAAFVTAVLKGLLKL